MKTTWLKGLNEQEKAAITAAFTASGTFRERLTFLANDKIRLNNNKRSSEEGYSNPNWAYMQADCSGYERAWKELISLLE